MQLDADTSSNMQMLDANGTTTYPKTTYCYGKLQTPTSIRILTILPGETDNPLVFCLKNAEVGGSQHYHALSYVWGPADDIHYIYCRRGYLNVTKNLFTALQNYRHVELATSLWVDAICINQEDLEERAQQILLMRRIYSECCCVYVWLGVEQPSDKQAFTFMQNLVDRYWNRVSDNQGDSKMIQELSKDALKSMNDDVLGALTRLLDREWFSRAWTFQEVACASKAVISWGPLEVPVPDIARFGTLVAKLGLSGLMLSHAARLNIGLLCQLLVIRDQLDKRSIETTLLRLAFRARNRQATDPRDKLYSLSGIATDKSPLPYPPSYRIGAEQLFKDFAAHTIRQNRSLEILVSCHFSSNARGPSWVPDWSVHEESAIEINRGLMPFCASGTNSWDDATTVDHNTLTVPAILVDHIKKVSQNFLPGVPFVQNLIKTSTDITLTSQYYASKNDQYQAWWRTLVGSRRGNNERVRPEFEQQVRAYLDVKTGLRRETPESDHGTPMYYEVEFRITSMASMRRFCLTEMGILGWVPQAAEVGDVVGVVAACDVPIMLRPAGESYLVIGPCYIHGIMDGEALDIEGMRFQYIDLV